MIKKSEPGFALTVRRCLQAAGRQLKAGCHRRERPTCPQAQETALSQTGPAQKLPKAHLPASLPPFRISRRVARFRSAVDRRRPPARLPVPVRSAPLGPPIHSIFNLVAGHPLQSSRDPSFPSPFPTRSRWLLRRKSSSSLCECERERERVCRPRKEIREVKRARKRFFFFLTFASQSSGSSPVRPPASRFLSLLPSRPSPRKPASASHVSTTSISPTGAPSGPQVSDLARWSCCLPYLWRHAGLIEWTNTVALVSQIGFLFLASGLLLLCCCCRAFARLLGGSPALDGFCDSTAFSNRSLAVPRWEAMGDHGDAPANEFLGRSLASAAHQKSEFTEPLRPILGSSCVQRPRDAPPHPHLVVHRTPRL